MREDKRNTLEDWSAFNIKEIFVCLLHMNVCAKLGVQNLTDIHRTLIRFSIVYESIPHL